MKTLVTNAHEAGPAVNGHDGCHARGSSGVCPGVGQAEWLNGLGDDDDAFGGSGVTCGQVRDNWLRQSHHLAPLDAEVAALSAMQRRLRRELGEINRELAVKKAQKVNA